MSFLLSSIIEILSTIFREKLIIDENSEYDKRLFLTLQKGCKKIIFLYSTMIYLVGQSTDYSGGTNLYSILTGRSAYSSS
jgi:hypothetical protein